MAFIVSIPPCSKPIEKENTVSYKRYLFTTSLWNVTTFNLRLPNTEEPIIELCNCFHYTEISITVLESCFTIIIMNLINFRYGIAHIGRVGSVFMTLSVTLERFFAILYPLKRLYIKTPLIVASVAFSCLYNIPRFLEFETIVTESEQNANQTEGNETATYQTVIFSYNLLSNLNNSNIDFRLLSLLLQIYDWIQSTSMSTLPGWNSS